MDRLLGTLWFLLRLPEPLQAQQTFPDPRKVPVHVVELLEWEEVVRGWTWRCDP